MIIAWPCARAAACKALFTERSLALVTPLGTFTLSFDGEVTTAAAADGSSIGVDLDVFEALRFALEGFYFQLNPQNITDPRFYVDAEEDFGARREVEIELWKAIAQVAPQWIPRQLPREELLVRDGAVRAAAAALSQARAELRANKTSATLKAAIAADEALDEADIILAEAHRYEAFVANLRAAIEGIDLMDTAPPTARIPSDRPRGP